MSATEAQQLDALEEALLGMRFPLAATAALVVVGWLGFFVFSVVLLGAAMAMLMVVSLLFVGLPTLFLVLAAIHALLARGEPRFLLRSVYFQVAFWWIVLASALFAVGALLLFGSMLFLAL